MMEFDAYIFDFDGTIAESGRGICNCVEYAVEKMGWPALSEAEKKRFIGPPLKAMFMEICGMDDEQGERAVACYRERYSTVGMFEADIYPGVAPMLRALKATGAWVAVASGKPTVFLKQIIDHFGLSECFDAVCGPDFGNHSSDKRAQILSALPEGMNPARACMIGDRCFDVDAGRLLGMHTVAVGYGYGAAEEFHEADAVTQTVADLTEYLLEGAPLPRGKMISFEGTDGCGKSTQMRLLSDWLRARGYEIVTTREPGGCPISEKIRELILSLDSKGMSAECEALLYAAARTEHVLKVLLPALNSGKIVLCDRFLDSSIAYQAYGRELGEDFIRLINKVAVENLTPDLTLQFDIDREAAKARLAKGEPLDRLEIEKDDFFARVAAGYTEVARKHPARIVRIDSGRSVEAVHADVLNAVARALN